MKPGTLFVIFVVSFVLACLLDACDGAELQATVTITGNHRHGNGAIISLEEFGVKGFFVVTALHVVDGCGDKARIKCDDSWFPCELIASDKENDIALLESKFVLSDPLDLVAAEELQIIGLTAAVVDQKTVVKPNPSKAKCDGFDLICKGMTEGMSGSSVLCGPALAGIVVGGYSESGAMATNKARVTSADCIRRMILKKFPRAHTVDESAVPAKRADGLPLAEIVPADHLPDIGKIVERVQGPAEIQRIKK